MLVLAVVLPPALRSGEHKPVTHVGDLTRPAPIELRSTLSATEALDDSLDLQELRLGVLLVHDAGERPFGAGAQLLLEVADVGIRRMFREQLDVAPGVVIDRVQRAVDGVDAFADGLALTIELGLKIGDLADSILVEQQLEASLEAGRSSALSCASICR